MEGVQSLRSSRQLLLRAKAPSPTLLRALRTFLCPIRPQAALRRHASSSAPPSKTIVLEQPDRFRPPSHSQRLVRGRPSRGGAYNQGSTPRERDTQQTRKYPHMFPNEGTFMHWFLTNRIIHLWLTLGVLLSLATISLTQTFKQTSPYAHLLPPLSSIIFHPLTFFREGWSVFRLHLDYTTRETAEARAQNILDAQKRRVFRRANGMEDLDAEDDQGVDVRGIVPWDDGLTNKERARGGRRIQVVSGKDLMEDGRPGETLEEYGKRKREEQAAKSKAAAYVSPVVQEQGKVEQQEQEQEQEPPQKRKRKVWLGIW